ncbi:MAG: GAF domain-containing protein [Anaerolineaceae bacterium]|nr:GAF domain-containing protein [Anaerolineaceae bacterium]
MNIQSLRRIPNWIYNLVISVPVRIKITGIILMTVLTLGLSLNYWVITGLSDWLSYLLTDVRVEAAMRAGNRSVLLMTVLAAAGSLVIASFLTFLLTRPLVDLRNMALEVAQGNLDARAPVWAKDEIGEVALAINTMTDHLLRSQDDLAQTNRRLAATNRIMMAAEREHEVHDVLYAILQNIVQVMELETGWVYLRDPERNVYHLASWYGVPSTLEDSLLYEGRAAGCSCQEALVEGSLSAHAHIRHCSRLSGVNGRSPSQHITIPIEARGQRYGVVNLLCRPNDPVDDADMEMLTIIGSQISEIVANAWLRLKLAEKEQARQMLLESLVEAQEDERGRLARELHDGAGQMLTTLLVRIKTLEKECPTGSMQNGLQTLLDMVSQTIEQVRELSYRLRPAALEEFGLPVALGILVDEMMADSPITARYLTDLTEDNLPPEIEVTLYRIAQEALTNVIRHARARTVQVALSMENQAILMSVKDDGCGFEPHVVTAVSQKRHLGLISMRERAAIAGGSLTLNTEPGAGTSVLVRFPLPEGIPV